MHGATSLKGENMGALDRLETYKAGVKSEETKSPFDLKTPEGCFFHLVQNNGYELIDSDGNYTELHNALVTTGNQYIQATAGSGKTTTLIFKIMHDIVTGETMRMQDLPNGMQAKVVDKVFVGTFLKSGAEELRSRLASWQRGMKYTVTANQVVFGTLHAEFKRALNAMGVATPIGNASTLNGLLRKAINSCNITRDGESLKNEDYKIIESVLTYYRGRLDNKRFQHPSAGDYGLTPSILTLLCNQYSSLKQANGVMDFEDLQELLYKYCYVTPNPNVIDFLANRYNFMYLDEFQDTSQIQYALIKVYMKNVSKEAEFKGKGKLVVVGDVQQCIYSFRGSDIEVMHTMYDKDFDATHCALSYNYRCPSNILNPVIPSIMRNTESEGIVIKPKNTGGTFTLIGMQNIKQMLTYLEGQLSKDMEEDNSVAVLCRTNYDGMIPALYLEMVGKYNYSVSSEAMTLASALPKRILRVTSIFTDRGTKSLKDTLGMFCGYHELWGVNDLCNTLKQNHLRLWDVPSEDLEYSCPSIADLVKEISTLRKSSTDIEVLKVLYLKLRTNTFGGSSQYCESARAIIDVIIFYLENNNFKTISEFREQLDLIDENINARIGRDVPISIATVHEFKGKERDSIYIWNDSDQVFPTSKTNPSDIDGMAEERRVHYIACTRAKKKSTIICSYGSPSIFVTEMDAKMEKYAPEEGLGGSL